jgi:DNA-binding transcriptional LysR family regulator
MLSSSPPPFDVWSFENRAAGLIIETIFYNIIDREIGLIAMMEFELLRSFVAVAECGGFHRAAEQLNLTQSTVSQQIKRLEQETNRPLFRRTTRTVALTDDGEMLLGDARRLLQLEEAARRRLTAAPLSGTVRLGAVEEVAGGSLPPALGRFASSHRNVKLEVQIGVSALLIEQLDAGRLDVVLAKRPLGTSRGRLVWREPMVWAAAAPFELDAGAVLPLALYRERSVSREAALIALRESKLDWEIVYTSPSLTGVRAAALAGLAITPLPASAVVAGLRVLGVESGLPLLPDLEFAIFERKRPHAAAAALATVLLSLGQTVVRPVAG